ncbi:hypothetical protein RND81_13G174700 [Saponaria officinalis]|uniref:Endonuclease/exonuclease/phosphatase domain-containing protein n=1 Tax=Saponaria officinalis TaxID=3572 RepID=A0AAW1H3P0_SAPOF
MIGLSWNCRGLGSPRAVNALKGIINVENPHFVFLSETKLKNKERLEHCMGEGKRMRGGLIFLWSEHVNLNPRSYSKNHIDMIMTANDKNWRVTGIRQSNDPWFCFGDFNAILSATEKQGGNNKSQREIDAFRDVVEFCGFREITYIGHPFTWSNGRGGDENVQERLDRAMATDEWIDMYSSSSIHHLPKRKSDHLPIPVKISKAIDGNTQHKRRRSFRFKKMWL